MCERIAIGGTYVAVRILELITTTNDYLLLFLWKIYIKTNSVKKLEELFLNYYFIFFLQQGLPTGHFSLRPIGKTPKLPHGQSTPENLSAQGIIKVKSKPFFTSSYIF